MIVSLSPGIEHAIKRFADIMGMSHEEAASYLLTRATMDMLASPGLSDLRRKKPKR